MSLSPQYVATARQALALYQQGLFKQALELCRPLLAQSPPQPGLINLAAMCARELGELDEAESHLRSAIAVAPTYATAHGNLGLVLRDANRPNEAEAAFQAALALAPNDPDTLTNLGNLYRAHQRSDEAERAYRRALSLTPQHSSALYNLGLLLADLDRLDEAEATFRDALKIQPNQADAWNDLGNVLMDKLSFGEAEQAYRQAVTLSPDYADAQCNLGMLLLETGEQKAAMAALRRTLELSPGHVDALNCIANQLSLRGQFEQAERAYRQALSLRPGSAMLHNNFGNLLRESGRFAEAEAEYRTAVSLQPDYGHALGQAVSCARNCYDWSRADEDTAAIATALEQNMVGIPALMALSLTDLNPAQLRRASELTATRSLQPYLEAPPLVSPDLHRAHDRLRVAYLSAEFHEHAVMHLLAGVLEAHDRQRFEVHAYSIGPDRHDAYRERVQEGCEHFHDLYLTGKLEAAKRIAANEIDILVDLSGHTGHARPAITALRPAPVIVSWLGYPGTMGLPKLADYIIGDAVLTPLEHAAHYSETIAWMPHCYQPNDHRLKPGPKPTRRDSGLPEDGFVFCSFNQPYKLTPRMFSVWCRLLDAVPGSVLWLQRPKDASAVDNLQREASQRGVAASRLVFAPVLPMPEHLARLQLADLALDPHPYGSGASGSNVLRAGVPMVTLKGESYVSRMAASQLHAVGLAELITSSAEGYFDLARDLALDPGRIAAVRSRLAANLPESPLFDTPRFTRDLEALYRRIWRDHERGVRAPITDW